MAPLFFLSGIAGLIYEEEWMTFLKITPQRYDIISVPFSPWIAGIGNDIIRILAADRDYKSARGYLEKAAAHAQTN